MLTAGQKGDVPQAGALIEGMPTEIVMAYTAYDADHLRQALADKGAKLDTRDYGNTDNRGGALAVHTWQAVDYADGLVRVGVQSAIGHPEAGALLRKLMTAQGMPAPPMGRTLESICITEACDTGQ